MQVLLRHSQTRLFFAGNKRWVSNPADAFHFGTISEAVERLQQEQLRRMELLIEGKTILPLGNATSGAEQK